MTALSWTKSDSRNGQAYQVELHEEDGYDARISFSGDCHIVRIRHFDTARTISQGDFADRGTAKAWAETTLNDLRKEVAALEVVCAGLSAGLHYARRIETGAWELVCLVPSGRTYAVTTMGSERILSITEYDAASITKASLTDPDGNAYTGQ